MMQARGRLLFVTWDGGGNLPPELRLAQELAQRGHHVTFLGHATQRGQIEAAGFAFDSFERSPAWDRLAPLPMRPRLPDDVLYQPLMAEDVQTEIERRHPDAIAVDCMLRAALCAVELSTLPAAVLVHSFCGYFMREHWPQGMVRLNQLRARLALARVDCVADGWNNVGPVLVMSLKELDPGIGEAPPHVCFIGPVCARAVNLDDDGGAVEHGPSLPLVLVSLTTLYHPEKVALLQRVLDGLASLPVQVLITAADVDRSDLRIPANAELYGFIPHAAVLPHAALVVCHGGHGTAMAALAHGVPLLHMPMFGDQRMVAASIEAAGAGRTLTLDAEPQRIRTAAQDLLVAAAYRQAAQRLAQAINRQDAAALGADALEALVREKRVHPARS